MEVLTQPNEITRSSTAISADGTRGAGVSRCGLATRAGVELSTRDAGERRGPGCSPSWGFGTLCCPVFEPKNPEFGEIGLYQGHKRAKQTLKSAVLVSELPTLSCCSKL